MNDFSVTARLKMELLSLVVIASSLVVIATQKTPEAVFAASLQGGILRMSGGEQTQIICGGSKLQITTQSVTQVLANCIAAIVTPVPTTPPLPPTPTTYIMSFDDHATGNLTGQYPNGVTWNGSAWMISGPWEQLNSNSLSFRDASVSQGTVSFSPAVNVVSLQAYNGATTSAVVTVSCPSQPDKTQTVAAKSLVTIATGFSGTCTMLTLKSTKGWDTNFDSIVYSAIGATGGALPTIPPVAGTPTTAPAPGGSGGSGTTMSGMSMAMMAWGIAGKNTPNPTYDKCDDGTDIVTAHNAYYVVAYDGLSYPTWHPSVVTNPITGSGKCYFGHEHGRNPADYQYYDEIAQHFGKDTNGDGRITAMKVSSTGVISAGDHAGLPFGIANEHMDQYYNKEGRDSIFVRHEDHVGHKVEFVNGEADMVNHSTHVMGNNTTGGVNIPYGSDDYSPTGVKCAQLHKIHQGVSTQDAIRNNLHELIIHSNCSSTVSSYKSNTIIATGMIPYGRPGEYVRFCAGGNVGDDRYTHVCADGGSSPNCVINDPLIAKLPADSLSNSLSRNIVDRTCLNKLAARGSGTYFSPYEIWEGSLNIERSNGDLIARIGRQWEVLDPIRFVDPSKPNGIGYNSEECDGLLQGMTVRCDNGSKPWNSTAAPFKGLSRSMYIARNEASNAGGSQILWTDPLGGNASSNQFASGLKQSVTAVDANFANISLPGGQTLNDRSIKREFDDEYDNSRVHAPN